MAYGKIERIFEQKSERIIKHEDGKYNKEAILMRATEYRKVWRVMIIRILYGIDHRKKERILQKSENN